MQILSIDASDIAPLGAKKPGASDIAPLDPIAVVIPPLDIGVTTFTKGPNKGLYSSPAPFPRFATWWPANRTQYDSHKEGRDAWKSSRGAFLVQSRRQLGLVSTANKHEKTLANGDADGVPTFQSADPVAVQRPMYWWTNGAWYPMPPTMRAGKRETFAEDLGAQEIAVVERERKRALLTVGIGALLTSATAGVVYYFRTRS